MLKLGRPHVCNCQQNLAIADLKCVTVSKTSEVEWTMGIFIISKKRWLCVTVAKNARNRVYHRCYPCVHCMAKVCNCHQKLVRRSPKLWKTIGNFRFPLRHFRCIKVCIAEATGPRLGSRINPCTLSCTPLRKADRALRINTPGCTESVSLLQSQFLYCRVHSLPGQNKKTQKTDTQSVWVLHLTKGKRS